MSLTTVIFGSIGVIAETSELQRRAFNDAFAARGIDTVWEVDEYQRLLSIVGGRARLREVLGPDVDEATIEALHEEKTRRFQVLLAEAGDVLRPGFKALVDELAGRGVRLGIASTTFRASIDAVLAGGGLGAETFGAIISLEDVTRAKPDPQAYELCLARLGAAPGESVAIEDTAVNLPAPLGAGIATVAVPGAYAVEQDFSPAALVVDSHAALGFERLEALLG